MKYNKELWDNIAKNHQNALLAIKGMMEDGCMYNCGFRAENFGKMAFHIQSTHGLPKEELIEILKQVK